MKKAEFVTNYTHVRTQALRILYKGEPHGLACLVASLCDVPEECERFWRKYRGTLTNVSAQDFFSRITLRDAIDVDKAMSQSPHFRRFRT